MNQTSLQILTHRRYIIFSCRRRNRRVMAEYRHYYYKDTRGRSTSFTATHSNPYQNGSRDIWKAYLLAHDFKPMIATIILVFGVLVLVNLTPNIFAYYNIETVWYHPIP